MVGKNRLISSSANEISSETFILGSISHQSAFIKKELFARYGLYDEGYRIFADTEKWIVFSKNSCRFKHLPVTCAEFYHNGISSRRDSRFYAENNKMLEMHYEDKLLFEKIINRTWAKRRYIGGLCLYKIRNKGLKKIFSLLGLPLIVSRHKFIGGEIKYRTLNKLFGFIPVRSINHHHFLDKHNII